jgi:hypothetical protein
MLLFKFVNYYLLIKLLTIKVSHISLTKCIYLNYIIKVCILKATIPHFNNNLNYHKTTNQHKATMPHFNINHKTINQHKS